MNPHSVVRPWVAYCTFKEQTVLLTALRGCDGLPREDPSKLLTRELRSVILMNADQDDPKFMANPPGTVELARARFIADLDHYPTHWLMHFTHACEVIGYQHPDEALRVYWFDLYKEIVHGLHLNVERPAQLAKRLMDRRPETPVAPEAALKNDAS